MAWIFTAALGAIVLLLAALYRRGLNENQTLTALLIQVLLDEDTYKFQQDGLHKLVAQIEAKNALDLSSRVQLSVSNLAVHLGGKTLFASHALLWQLKQRGGSGSGK